MSKALGWNGLARVYDVPFKNRYHCTQKVHSVRILCAYQSVTQSYE